MSKPNFFEMAAWLHEHDLGSKLEGWLVTNDSDNICCIPRLDDPLSMYHQPGWPNDFTQPKFASDEEAIEFVRRRAAAGSRWHAQAITIHDGRIPMSLWLPDRTLSEQILERCSAGPWRHGLYAPGFSADGQLCIYGDERELPLAILHEDDDEANANIVLLAASYELVEELGLLLAVLDGTNLATLPDAEALKVRKRAASTLSLLSRINGDMQQSIAERYGEEQADE
jgi:hypothetical protein